MNHRSAAILLLSSNAHAVFGSSIRGRALEGSQGHLRGHSKTFSDNHKTSRHLNNVGFHIKLNQSRCWENIWETAVLVNSFGYPEEQERSCSRFEHIGSEIVLAEDNSMCLTAGSGQKINGKIRNDLNTEVTVGETVGMYPCANDSEPFVKARQQWNVDTSSTGNSKIFSVAGLAIEHNGFMGLYLKVMDDNESRQHFHLQTTAPTPSPTTAPTPNKTPMPNPEEGAYEVTDEEIDTLLEPIGEIANEPWDCVWEEVQDAVQCGTEAVVCGYRSVRDGAKCGWKTVTSAADCGTKIITDIFQCGMDFLGGAKSCSIAKTCKIANECEIPIDCDIAKKCDVEKCKQTIGGGKCAPGLIDCDVVGFACKLSFDSDVFRCMPDYDEDMNVADPDVCKDFYDENLAEFAKKQDAAMTWSNGSGASLVASGSLEVGTVYGPKGEYGCFNSNCAGYETDLSASTFFSIGVYENWDAVPGTARVVSLGIDTPVFEFGFSPAIVFSEDHTIPIGSVTTVSLGVGVLPVGGSHLTCATSVYDTSALI